MCAMDSVSNVIYVHSIKEFKNEVFGFIQLGYSITNADYTGAIMKKHDEETVGITTALGESDEEEALEDWLERVFEKRMHGALTSAFLGLFLNTKE